MEPLKEMFNKPFYENLAKEISRVHKDFDPKRFVNESTRDFHALELNQRLRRTSEVLKVCLPSDYKTAVEIMKKVIPNLKTGYTNLVFPDFVGLYGKEHFDFSLGALKYFTCFGSSEFAIREYLKLDFHRTLKVMVIWASDKDHHVRRLASEGSRPRLPWSFKLDQVIKDPSLTYPILEILKDDKELYVRKSVANHLNDISKEHPGFLLDIIKTWKGKSPHTDWILKHASRTLLKKGDTGILKHFGIKHSEALKASKFKIKTRKIETGGDLEFSFRVDNTGAGKIKIRLEYAVYFRIASGKLSKKVFKISERELEAKSSVEVKKKHSFREITTRSYYPGEQKITLIVNGKESEPIAFVLK
jgi:3-methyladenine DNA glycosylase AlkC